MTTREWELTKLSFEMKHMEHEVYHAWEEWKKTVTEKVNELGELDLQGNFIPYSFIYNRSMYNKGEIVKVTFDKVKTFLENGKPWLLFHVVHGDNFYKDGSWLCEVHIERSQLEYLMESIDWTSAA